MPLTAEQCHALDEAKKRIGGKAKKFNPEAVRPEPPKDLPEIKPETSKDLPIPEAAGIAPGAPAKAASKMPIFEVGALFLAFLLPTVASMSNTFKVSHYLSNEETTSKVIMLVVSGTPILFMLGRVNKYIYFIVGGAVILLETLFNLSAVYISLMDGMTYIFGTPTGKCSPFLDTICRVTNSGQQGTAIALGLIVALCLAAVQLSAFYELKKRIV